MGLTGPSQSDVQSVKSGLEKNLGKQSILIKPEIDKASLASFKRELATQIGAVSVPVTIKMVSSSAATVSQSVSKQVGNSRELKDLERNLSAIEKEFQKIERSKAAHSIHTMSESLEQFADRSGIALKRFLAFTVATTGVIKLASEIRQAFGDAIKFEENLVKVSQVSERNLKQLNSLRSSILDVSRAVGTSAVDLSDATLTIAQAGLPLNKVKEAMDAIAKANVSPTFGSSKESAEALIATISQFKSEATNLEAILSKINFISAKEAVESQDLVDAIQRGGGAAALAGTKFNEYLSIITAVRATTRESADQIATGIRTITANIASPATIEFFRKKYKVDIAPGDKVDDLVTAIDKIKTRLGQLGELPTIKDIIDPETGKITQELTNKSVAFSEALEKLGGKRNQSRLIPLFTELSKIKQLTSSFDEVDPLTGLKKSENTFANDVQKSQAALQRSIDSTKTAFLQLGDEILKNEGTRGLIELFLGVSRAIADTTKEVVKLSTVLAPIFAPMVARGIGTFARAFSPSRLFGAPSQFRAHGGEIFGNTPGDSVPCMLTPGEVVLNKSQQQNLGRVMGTDPKNVFGKIGVPGFSSGGEVSSNISKAIFGKSVAEQTRKYIDDGKLYVFDNSYGVYHKVNKDFSISEDFYDTLPRGAKSISIQPYSSKYETGQRKGANLLPITDPKLTKLDEIGLSTIAPSSSVDPIIDRLSAIGGLTPLSLLREINKRRPGFNQLVKTSFGESNVQGQGVFGRRGKTGITIEDAAEIISRYKSGYGSGFFSQDKLPGPNIGELRVHIAVDDSGKVRLVKSGTQQKYTGLQQAIQSIGFNKGEAKETLTGFSKAAKVTAFKTIQELVSKKGIKGAFFGVDVGSTSYAAAQKSGINTQKFRGLNRDFGTVVYELNPSEESGSSGYLGGQGIGRFVQDVIGVKNDKIPASDKIVKDRIIQIILGKGPSSVQTIDDSEKIAAEKSYARMLDYITNANKQEEYGPKIGKFRRLFSAAKSKISDAFTANPFDKNGMTAFQAKLNKELEYTDVFGNDKVRGQTSIERFADLKKKYGIGVGKFAHGGTVPGSGHGDTVPALLSPGEVVLNKRQQGKLDQLTGSSAALFKAAGVPGFNAGGVIGKVATGIALGGSFLPSIEGFGGVKDILEAVAPIIGTVAASFIGLRSAFENVKGMNDWKDGLEESNKALAYSAKNLDQFKKEIDLSSKEFQKASKTYDSKNFKGQISKAQDKVTQLESAKAPQEQIDSAKLVVQRLQNKENELASTRNAAARRMNTAILDPRIKENEKIIRQENEKIALNSKQIAQVEKNAKIAAAVSAVGLGASVFLVGRGTKQISQSENFNKESEASGRFNLAAGSAIGGGIAGAGTGFQLGGVKGAAIGGILGTVAGTYQGIIEADSLIREKYSAALKDLMDSISLEKVADQNQIAEFDRIIRKKYNPRDEILRSTVNLNPIEGPIGGVLGGVKSETPFNKDLYLQDKSNFNTSKGLLENTFGTLNDIMWGNGRTNRSSYADPDRAIAQGTQLGSEGGKYFKNTETQNEVSAFLKKEAAKYTSFDEFNKKFSQQMNLLARSSNLERDIVDRIYKNIIEDKESITNKQKDAIKAFDDQANDIEKFNASLSHSLEKIKRSSIGVLLGESIRVQAPSLRKPDFTSAAQTQDFNRDVRSVTGGFGDFGKKIGADFTNLLSEQQRFEGVLSDIRSGKKENGLTATPKDLIDQFFKTSNLKETDKSVLSANAEKYITSDNFNRDNIRAATDAQQIFSDSAENYKKVLNPMTEATIEATNRLLDFGSKVSELRDKAEDLRKPFDSISQILDIRGQSRELTADQVMVAQRQSESARTIGETGGLTAAQLRSNILGGDQRLQGLQKKLDVAQNAQERASLVQQITAEEAARTKATKGLEFLANSTQELSVVQQQLQKAESDRMNKRSLFETLAFGSSDDRFSARRNIQRLNSGQALGTEGTREVVNFLRQFGETSLKELGINRQGTASQEAERISADFIRKQQGQFGLNVAGRDLGQEILQSPEQKKLGREAEGLVKRQQDAKNEQANVLDTRAREVAQQAFKEFNDVFKNFKAENLVVNAEKVVLNGAADIKGAIALEGNVNVAVNINAPGFEQMGEELKKNVMGQVNAQVIKILKNNGIPVDRPVV